MNSHTCLKLKLEHGITLTGLSSIFAAEVLLVPRHPLTYTQPYSFKRRRLFFLDFLVVIRYQRCGFDGILPRPRGVSRLVRKVQPATPFGHEIVSNARHGARAEKGKCHVVTFTISVPDEALRSSLVIKLHSHSHSQEFCAFPKSAYRRSTVQVSAQELSMPKVCSKRAAKRQ